MVLVAVVLAVTVLSCTSSPPESTPQRVLTPFRQTPGAGLPTATPAGESPVSTVIPVSTVVGGQLLVATTRLSSRPESDLPPDYRLAWLTPRALQPIRLTGDSAGVAGAAASPDGSTIVAIVGTNRVTTIGKDGRVLQDLVPTLPSIGVLQPSAYTSVAWLVGHQVLIRQTYPGGLLVADYVTGRTHLLPKTGLDPAPSPDGQHLALGYYTSEAFYSVYVTDLEFKSPRKLTADHVTESSPAWSPDGQWIAYAANVGFADENPSVAWELRIVHPDGTGQRTLMTRRQNVSYPTIRWSPDGQRVAFTEYDVASHRHRVGITGKDDAFAVTLTNDNTNAFVLGWIR